MTTGRNTTTYQDARAADFAIGATRGIDAVISQYGLDALILPTEGYASSPAAIVRVPPPSSASILSLPCKTSRLTSSPSRFLLDPGRLPDRHRSSWLPRLWPAIWTCYHRQEVGRAEALEHYGCV
jgi:hypothetical protein